MARATKLQPITTSILVNIADSGSGIPPEIQSRIYEPFLPLNQWVKAQVWDWKLCGG